MNSDYDLAIVGAGFAGLACARSAAVRGLRTLVIERQAEPGSRLHTTGLLVKEVAERWEVPAELTRRIRGVRLYGPSLRSIDLESPGYYFMATDTAGLMRWFARAAGRAGAHLVLGRPYRGARRTAEGIELLDRGETARFLVGADGPRSAVARDFGLGHNRHFLYGAELELAGVRGLDPERLHCFLDADLAPGYIGWAFVGVDDVVQVGLACRPPAKPDIDAFLTRLVDIVDLRDARRVGRRGGVIPVGGRVHPYHADRVLLAGDAAGIVSPLTAGGIHTALDSGWRAAHAIADHLMDGAPAPVRAVGDAYPRFFWKQALRRLFDLHPPNWLLDAAFATPPLRALAQAIYFHRRGLLSARAWGEILGRDARRRRAG